MAALIPLCASLIASVTPPRPRAAKSERWANFPMSFGYCRRTSSASAPTIQSQPVVKTVSPLACGLSSTRAINLRSRRRARSLRGSSGIPVLQSLASQPSVFAEAVGSGNHELMICATFTNLRIRNLLVEGIKGGQTHYFVGDGDKDGKVMPIDEVATRYRALRAPKSAGLDGRLTPQTFGAVLCHSRGRTLASRLGRKRVVRLTSVLDAAACRAAGYPQPMTETP